MQKEYCLITLVYKFWLFLYTPENVNKYVNLFSWNLNVLAEIFDDITIFSVLKYFLIIIFIFLISLLFVLKDNFLVLDWHKILSIKFNQSCDRYMFVNNYIFKREKFNGTYITYNGTYLKKSMNSLFSISFCKPR